ncbi:MAG: class I SAM-dependent methyltransferase, partial [Candidatus Paceibacterota bacterium]
LVIMNNFSTDEHIGGNLERRIRGREMLIKKHFQEYLLHPILLAKQYFWLGLMYRQNGKFSLAADYFVKAWRQDKKIRYTFHFLWAKIRESKQKILQSKFFRPIHFGTLLRLKYFNRFLILNKKNNNFKNILDAGCGHGKYSKLLADYYPSASVLGIDILEDEEWGNYPNKNLCFKVFDLKNFREQNIYDLIVSIDTLEHIVDNKKVITNLIEALRPSGLIYLAIPCDKTSIHIFPRRWFQRFHDWESDEHLGEQPVLDELKQEMKERNLEILVSRHTFTFWGTLGWEFEFLLRGKKLGDRLNIILMPFYNLLCFLDIWLPIGRGNNLILARKK